MSYFGFLAVFIGVPIVVLLWTLRRGKSFASSGPSWPTIGVLAAVAVVYTTPWDNYLVATGVWWYDPGRVTGVVLGWVPVEEYIFFILQPVLAGLWMRFLFRAEPAPGRRTISRSIPVALAVLVWGAGLGLLLSGWRPGTYLGLELAWALPPVILQLAFGGDLLARYFRTVVLGIAVPALYLSAADALAIGAGIWTIDPAQSTGLLLGGVLPVEEFVFFLLTSTLLALSYLLIWAPESRERLGRILRRTALRERGSAA